MRRATMSTAWLLDASGEVEGLSFGSDACTEHEVGIAGLRYALRVPGRFEEGLPDRTATRQPPWLRYSEYKDAKGVPCAWLALGSHPIGGLDSGKTEGPLPSGYFGREVVFHEGVRSGQGFGQQNLVCAWGEDSALVHVRTAEEVRRLETLFNAFAACDIAFGGDLVDSERHPVSGGLVFVLASKVNKEIALRVLEKDQKAERLRDAVEKLGLDTELRATGCEWFALSPRWKDDEESEIMFWLNPREQSRHNFGWFTPDELRQWARGEGPVMMNQPAKPPRRPR